VVCSDCVRSKVRTMNWQPTTEMITWGKEHLGAIPVDGVWSPEGSGVQYRKTAENTFALMFMYNHPECEVHHERYREIITACGYDMLEGDGVQKITPPLDPMARMQQEFEMKQEQARGWLCPSCEYPLANCELDEREDLFVETVDAELTGGDSTEIEIWSCNIKCTQCDEEIKMNPDDYHLLAGDEYYMRWRVDDSHQYMALTRGQMKEMQDAGVLNGEVLGSIHEGKKVPPWMWGIYAIKRAITKSEEDE